MKKILSALFALTILAGSVSAGCFIPSQAASSPLHVNAAEEETDPLRERYKYLLGRLLEEAMKESMFSKFQDLAKFTIVDICGDDNEKLVIRREDTTPAQTLVTNSDKKQIALFKGATTFYSSGCASVKITDTTGLSGKFSPVEIYTYDAKNEKYVSVGSVQCWDKSKGMFDSSGKQFPSYADTDEAGIVYYIDCEADGFRASKPVSQSTYEQWRDRYIPETLRIDPVYSILKTENINAVDTKAFPPEVRYDINGDGIISSADYVSLAEKIINPSLQSSGSHTGDTNRDGKTNVSDLFKIIKYLNK